MLTRIPTRPGLLFGSFLYRNDRCSLEQLLALWENHAGSSFVYFPEFNPSITYYAKEMGTVDSLERFFVFSLDLHPREALLQTKLRSLDWEARWAPDGRRNVNVDVGLLSLENFILATTKNYSHRIFLGEDIFADLTYYFHQGRLQVLPWTYPDFVDETKLELFRLMRSYLLQKFQP
jgi:hypothetical protein